MRRKVARALAALFLSAVAAPDLAEAQSQKMPAGRTPLYCAVEQSANQEAIGLLPVMTELADQNGRISDEMRKLIDQPKFKSDRPISESLTVEEATRFGNLQQQTKNVLVASIIESHRERDIRVIGRMAVLADRAARPGFDLPTKGSEDYWLTGALMALREVIDQDQPRTKFELLDTATKCDLEIALADVAPISHPAITRVLC